MLGARIRGKGSIPMSLGAEKIHIDVLRNAA